MPAPSAPPHLLHVFSTFAPGGYQVRTSQLLVAFGGEFRHSLLPMDGRRDAENLLSGEVNHRFVDPPPKAGSLPTALRLRRLLRELRPDLLLTYNFGSIDAVLAARSIGLRSALHHEDGFLPDESGGDFKRRRILLRRLALPGVHGVIVPSHTLQHVASELWKVPDRRLHLIPNGIHLETFPPADGHAELRARYGIPERAPVIGYVGHLRREKNPARLLRAFARLVRGEAAEVDDAHVLVLGDGPERAELEAIIVREGLAGRVHLVGHQVDPRPWYRAMDLFAMSSDTEQMPVALLEAMACGLPVVATDVGDVRHILPPGQGYYLVSLQRDAEETTELALGDALRGLLGAGEGARQALGSANLGRVRERYGFESMLEAYRRRYAEALQAR